MGPPRVVSACCSPFSQAAQIWVSTGPQFDRGTKPAFLCSFLVTARLQDKRAPFEPRGGPEMGKDKNQAGQMGPNPHPLWYRAPQVFWCWAECPVPDGRYKPPLHATRPKPHTTGPFGCGGYVARPVACRFWGAQSTGVSAWLAVTKKTNQES